MGTTKGGKIRVQQIVKCREYFRIERRRKRGQWAQEEKKKGPIGLSVELAFDRAYRAEERNRVMTSPASDASVISMVSSKLSKCLVWAPDMDISHKNLRTDINAK